MPIDSSYGRILQLFEMTLNYGDASTSSVDISASPLSAESDLVAFLISMSKQGRKATLLMDQTANSRYDGLVVVAVSGVCCGSAGDYA